MECNKEEAIRAMDIAKRKVTENDYDGAKKFAEKAQNLYPNLEGLKQMSMMIEVYIVAGNKICGGESDWYGILGVDPLADDDVVKKQYKKLALLLHPDKNKCKGAEETFKLVSEAWCLLSDKVKRIAYDQKRKLKEVKPRKSRKPKEPPNPQKQPANKPYQPPKQRKQPANQQKQPANQPKQPANQQKQPPKQRKQPPRQQQQPPSEPKQPPNEPRQPPNQPKPPPSQQQQPSNQPEQPQQPPNQQHQPPSQPKQPPNQQQQQPPSQQKQSPKKQTPNQPSSSGVRNVRSKSNKPTSKVGTFWTMCKNCKTEYEYVRVFYFNKTLLCRNCQQTFKATENEKEKTPEAITKNANCAPSCGKDPSRTVSVGDSSRGDCSTSRMVDSDCRNVANHVEESAKRGVEDSQGATKGIANSDFEVEERVFKKLRTDDYAEINGGIKV